MKHANKQKYLLWFSDNCVCEIQFKEMMMSQRWERLTNGTGTVCEAADN